MSKYLVIVESPTKAKTISRILGNDFEVASSMGHIVDLPAKSLGIDVEHGFIPEYKVIPGKDKIVKEFKKKAKGVDMIYLATDHDREGEAIGWHIKNILSQSTDRFSRVIFHEITEEAIREAFNNPSELDVNKVNAQKTRRILDRIVGYYLSPLLWRNLVRGLSAGRVQSIALKFVIERERLISKFKKETTYGVEAVFSSEGNVFKGKLVKYEGEKSPFRDKDKAEKIIGDLAGREVSVRSIRKRETKKQPPPPFTTSLLQQEAFHKLRFSSQKTMVVAQKLYEGIQIEDKMLGLITYMRTDSFFISDKAKTEAKNYVGDRFGKDYLADKEYGYKEKKGAQRAHEAIRPTGVSRDPASIAPYLTPDEAKLYELIWKRFVACFMKESVIQFIKVKLCCDKAEFLSEGRVTLFDGYQKVIGRDDDADLPGLREKQIVETEKMEVVEHTTKPPARFTDASLVKLLEEKGIGRPSTYAPTIFTLLKRNYVRREKGHFIPTELGGSVYELLLRYFPGVLNDNFTALIEDKLDSVENGKIEGIMILEEFYPPFKEKVDKAKGEIKKRTESTGEVCPDCGKPLVIKWSRKGKFFSCSNFPECRYARSITTGIICPQCKKGELIQRRNKKGQYFYGCTEYPQCTYTSRVLPGDGDKSKNKDEDKDKDKESKEDIQ